LLKEVQVERDYPRMLLDRRNSKLMTLEFANGEFVRLQLQNHRIRDVLYLLIQRMQSSITTTAVQ